VIALLAGDDGRVLSITPPLCIEREILEIAVDLIALALA
jgi:4-aminobutyrate aminotransferase-like enzyme